MSYKYLDQITIQNLAAFEDFKAQFHDITVVVGQNEAGKSSFLRCVASIFQGGADRDLLRTGTKKGLASYSFSNGYAAFKEINPEKKTGYTVWVQDPNGGKITSGAATMVNEWLPKDCFDARTLMHMIVNDPTALEKYMLDHWPVEFSGEELNPILRGMLPAVSGKRSLGELNAMRQTLYDQRTETKRDAAEAKATLDSLRAAVGGDEGTDWGAEVKRLTKESQDVAADLAKIESDIKADADETRRERREQTEAQIKTLREMRSNYAALIGRYHAVLKGISPETRNDFLEIGPLLENGHRDFLSNFDQELSLTRGLEEFLAKLAKDEATYIEEESKALRDKQTLIAQQLGTAQANSDQQQQRAGLKAQIATQETRMKGHVTKETTLTMVLEDIDREKAKKLKEFPIEGIDINLDGKKPVITINGKPLSTNINTQNQMKIAVQFLAEAQKRAGAQFRIIVMEGAELDINHLVELGAICRAEKIQLIVSVLRPDAALQVMNLEEFVASERKAVAA